MEKADQLCDRVGIIDSGKIQVIDSPENMKKAMGNEVISIIFEEGENHDSFLSELEKIEFVKSWVDLTSIIGSNPDKAVTVLSLLASSKVTCFAVVILFKTFNTKLEVSMSTFCEVVSYSRSISSAIDLK